MAQFAYKARRRSGELVRGVLEGTDRANALSQIERLGLFPVTVEPAKGTSAVGTKTSAEGKARAKATQIVPPAIREFLQRRRKPKLQELATFTQQLANLLESGMPLTVALNSISHLESKGISPEVGKQLKQEVMEGKSLSDAMAKQPVIFTELYVNMVRAGEQSGALAEVLKRLAAHYERFAEVQSKFVSAMIYPAIVVCVGIVIVFCFMTFMLPKFLSIFEGMDARLPTSTQMLVDVSNFLGSYWWAILLVVVALVVIFERFKNTETGRVSIDRWKMQAPVVGKVVRLNLFAQFARTLSTLLHNGVPVLTALRITEKVVPNQIVRDAIAKTREGVTDGKTIAEPLARSKIFPQLMLDLLKIGEDTGDVPGALDHVANTYENELSIALRVLTNLIEPALIILMAIGVGGLLFSILSAMFAITSSVVQ